ncbi:MAG: ComF family protein [Pseudobdellovibrionaceae bacterium]|nr:ComF family protein [Pseudobdellovibrionaceae bacterium]
MVLPARCALTGRIVDRNGALSPEAWASLTFISDPVCACCGIPFEISERKEAVSDREMLCGGCLQNPKPYFRARSVFVYDDASRDLVLAFKHGDQTHLTVTFGPLLVRVGEHILKEADLIVPVPLHWRRLVRRRYNQAGLLAQALSGLSCVPYHGRILRRIRYTLPQGHKRAKERSENVRGAFSVPPVAAERINGKNIVLVDDVYTTGATLEACVHALLRGGASRVDVLTLARVVKAH